MKTYKTISWIGLVLITFVIQSTIASQIMKLLNLSSTDYFILGVILLVGQFLGFWWCYFQIFKQINNLYKNK